MSKRPSRNASRGKIGTNVGETENSSTVGTDDDDDEYVDDVKEETETPAQQKRKKRRKTFNLEEEDFRPSFERKTENGGYAHTNLSRSRISKANTGNVPWNKGKIRSSADKAKIAAGVRARNRTILLEKLKRLGMTEEEWLKKKKEIKYLRERVRKAKLSNANQQASLEKKLKAAIDSTMEEQDRSGSAGATKESPKKKTKTSPQPTPAASTGVSSSAGNMAGRKNSVGADSTERQTNKNKGRPKEVNVFAKDGMVWSESAFDGKDESYFEALCPSGGPGGLICCAVCSKIYSNFLSQTAKDIEVQKTRKIAEEAKEMIKFIEQGRTELDRSVSAAKRRVPPASAV